MGIKPHHRVAQLFGKTLRRATDVTSPLSRAGTSLTFQSFLMRLIWLSVLPLILLAAYLSFDSVRDDQSQRDQAAANLAKNFATAIDHELTARIQGLQLLAASPQADDAARREDFYQEAQAFNASFGSHVILTDLTLQMLINTRVPWGTPLPVLPRPKGRAAAPIAIDTGQPAVGDIVFGPVANEPLVAIAVPGQRHGKTAFLLLTTPATSQFQQRLQRVALPDGWALTLLDGTGAVIARRAPASADAANAASAASVGARFVAISTLAPWSVRVEIPLALYRAPQVAAAAALVLLVLGASLSGVLGGSLAARRLGRAVARLAQPGVAGAPHTDIAEIEAVRGVLKNAARQRASAEADLQQSELRFRLAASTGNVWDWNVATGKVSFPQESWSTLGYEAPPGDAAPAMLESLLHPDDRARWRQALADHIKQHVPYELDFRARTQSGEYLWFNLRGQAQWDERGRATYMAGVIFNITERKRLEERNRAQLEHLTHREAESTRLLAQVTESRRALLIALEEQKQAHAALAKSQRLLAETERMGKVGGWEFDMATGKLTWTPEVYKIHEVDPGFEPTVDNGVNFYAPACRATIEQALRRAIEQGEPFDMELEIITAKGHLRSVHTIGQADPPQHRVYGFFQDITERQRAELEVRRLNAELEQRVAERTAQLALVNQELDTFAYSVSHDLKTPLRGIDGYSALLQEECADQLSADGRLFVDNIRQGARQMNALIDDLLAYSRMERRTLHNQPLPLRDLVQAVVAEQAQAIDRQGANVRVVLPALVALADREGVAIVLRNLLENALKFSRDAKPPVIEIGGRDENNDCTLWVRDNGIGFDMQFHDRIFDIFQRLQRSEDFPGTGIGLALVSKAVVRMGGRVWAQSAPGAGATFFVSLPKYVVPPESGVASGSDQTKED